MSKASTQYFDWGQIEWKYEPEYGNSTNIMHIGFITIFPGKKQIRHVHYGDEQFLYVLSGKGEQLIDDKVNILEPGAGFHIDAGSVHETINTGDEPIIELLISIPANYQNNLFVQNKVENLLLNGNKYKNPINIDSSIKDIYDEFIRSLKIPLSIFDVEGNIIIKGQGYPEYCEAKCSVGKNLNNCCIYGIKSNYASPQYPDPSAYICPYGLTVFVVPMLYNHEVIGIIKGGHIKNFSGESYDNYISDMNYESIPLVPKARMQAISLQLKKLSKSIIDYYIIENTETELGKKEEIIQDICEHEIMLEKSLKSTQEKVLNIQMNNHFLFNTLNAIAGLAIKENALKTYESIISLSKMFRYSLKTSSSFVSLKDELEYLGNFIDLQKLRYGDRLEVRLDVSDEIKDTVVPFNCLQPIMENCFIHGFKEKKSRMFIEVSGRRDMDSVIIEICDNGIGMDERDIEALNKKIQQMNGSEVVSGLILIFSKLKLFYDRGFSFKISGALNQGTCVKIIIFDKLT